MIGAQDSGPADPDPADPALELVADRGAIERIMANLLTNALAAAAGGHVWLSASAGPAATETVILAVTDDGPGFPPGAAARAFERFYRADPARTGAGAGLGSCVRLRRRK